MTVVDLEARTRQYNDPVPQERAEALGAKVMAAASDVAKQDAVFLQLVGEFDAINGAGWWSGIHSTAHWLSWACSMSMGTAREHVRVARALRRMPLIHDAFATGELTYSKVREITRVLQHVDAEGLERWPAQDPANQPDETPETADPAFGEAAMLDLARSCTASQLARTVSGWRAAKGLSKHRRAKQQVAWFIRPDGSVHFVADLPPEEGAALIAAVQAGTDANQETEARPGDEQPDDELPDYARVEGADRRETTEQKLHRTRVEALVEIANHYLAARPDDRSGEDRTMVVIEVNAAALEELTTSGTPGDVASNTTENRSRGNVANPLSDGKCRVRGGAAIEPADARRAACDATVLGVIIDQKGMPLAVGREQRLVTKHQRRALMSRDSCCQYPGCDRTRHLKAHHRTSWLDGGPTDLDNLILLCQRHHTRVHEDQISITPCDAPGCGIPWKFARPDGTTIAPTVAGLDAPSPWQPGRGEFRRRNDQLVADWEAEDAKLHDQAARLATAYEHIHDTRDPDARKVFPVGGGAGFNLASCVDALFHLTEPQPAAA